jgi:hypothetical protein
MTRRNIEKLTIDRLREVLAYNPETGELTWRKRTGPMCNLGGIAGCVKKDGYRKITVDGAICNASQLAWFHYHGTPAPGLLDHKNGIRSDNRIANLRPATYSQNSQNIAVRANNSSGLKGASKFYNPNNRAKFRSSITVNKKRIFLGLFMTAEAAHEAYCRAARELHGEFFRINKTPEIPMSQFERTRAALIARRESVGAKTPTGQVISTLVEQLESRQTYVRPPWANDRRQTLDFQIEKSMARLANAM